MNLRTGDILVWRSTNYYDTLEEITIQLKGLHSGLVLVGEEFAEISDCGPSPSHTYVTFLVDSIFPIEEVVGSVWYRPNGASLHHIRRINGRDIPSDEALRVFKEYIRLWKRPHLHTAYIAVASYFRYGGIASKTGHANKRWNLCSIMIGHLLKKLRILHPNAEENNLLPIDFYDLRFYQTDEYENICIFDKKTYTKDWFFAPLLVQTGQLQINPIYNDTVNTMLTGYDYPQRISAGKLKKQADAYLNGC